MKLTTPVNCETAIQFMRELQDNGLAYHPEDSAVDCLSHHGLSAEVLQQIDANTKACFDVLPDPCAVAVALTNASHWKTEFETFKTSQNRISHSRLPEHCRDLYRGNEFFLYDGGLVISILERGKYRALILKNEYQTSDLEALEMLLFEFALDEGAIETLGH